MKTTEGQKKESAISKEWATLDIKRQKPADHVVMALQKIRFLHVEKKGKDIRARHVENKDAQKNPNQFWQITFGAEQILIEWTPRVGQNNTARKIYVAKNALDVLALLESAYPVTIRQLRTWLWETVETAHCDVMKSHSHWALENELQRNTIQSLEKEKKQMRDAQEKLNEHIGQLAEQNERLTSRLALFDHVSDLTLKSKIVQSVQDHHVLDPFGMADELGLPVARIESALEQLIQDGYVQPVD